MKKGRHCHLGMRLSIAGGKPSLDVDGKPLPLQPRSVVFSNTPLVSRYQNDKDVIAPWPGRLPDTTGRILIFPFSFYKGSDDPAAATAWLRDKYENQPWPDRETRVKTEKPTHEKADDSEVFLITMRYP